ncbi:MAG: S-layer homology domain-containing protein, partial [Clostridia bacterium]|nr:S-layer homology domain-containing protein [Clostridia bacterium]
MKKLLSILLAMMMLLSSVTYAEEVSKYEEDIAILKSFNVISYFSGSVDPDAAVTRAEFLKAVLELTYEGIPDCNGNTGFSDVDAGSDYADAVAFAKSVGIIDGVSDSEFHPDSLITGIQACKILLTAMGYKDLAVYQGGYTPGYYTVANRVDLLDGVTAGENETITAGALAKLLLNAGFADPLEVKQKIGGIVFEMAAEDTIFWRIHSIAEGEGVLSSNEYTALDSSSDMGGSKITIGNFNGYAYNNINAEQYMGYYVDFYYREAETGNTVLYILPDEDNNDIITIDGDNVKSFADGVLSYYKNENKSNLKTKEIPLSASVIYNGRLITTYTADDFVGITGEIVLIDNDCDGNVDVVNIVSYENYIINSIDTRNSIIYDLLDGSRTIDYSNEYNSNAFVIWDKDGKRVAIDDLKAMDVLTVAKSKDSSYIRALLNNEIMTGTVTGMNSDDEGVYLYLDGVEYEVEKHCNEKQGDTVVMNESATVYLDVLGRIAYIEPKSSKEGFAAVIKTIDEDVETGRGAVRVMTSNGKVETFYLADKVVVDGSRYTNSKQVPANVALSRIIRYKLNSNDELKWIDTPIKTDENGGSIHKISTLSNAKYIGNSKSFSGALQMNTSMLVFKGPESTADAVSEDYSISAASEIADQSRYTGEAYAVADDAVVADALLLYDTSDDSLVHTSPTAVISKVIQTINSDGEDVYRLTLISRDNDSFDLEVLAEDYFNGATSGDVIKYAIDTDGYIKQMEIIFDSETTALNHNEATGRGTPLTGLGTSYDSEFKAYWGKVINKDGKIIQFELDSALLNNSSNKTAQFTYHDLSLVPAKIITVDTSETASVER